MKDLGLQFSVMMDPTTSHKPRRVQPRIIIHGGAGNISRENLTRAAYEEYRAALLSILSKTQAQFTSNPDASALDVATYAVSQLENCPLFNAGHGAVYTTAGTHELEASVMVSRGYRKRGVGVMKVTRVRNPILLARELLVRGEEDGGGGAQGHSQLEGETCDLLAQRWGLERVAPSYFWTKKRWDEHRRGLGLGSSQEEYDRAKRAADEGVTSTSTMTSTEDAERDPINWDGKEYLPQGTVGAVVLDAHGVVAVATSTGGLTNKLPGRIGDTPTIGAGFFAEEWALPHQSLSRPVSPLASIIQTCLPSLSSNASPHGPSSIRAVAMSGTGNGDSFLRTSAVRTAAAIAQFASQPSSSESSIWSSPAPQKAVSLQDAVTAVSGRGGTLQRSAGDRWGKTGEGEGGIIGIDLVHGKGEVVFDFNCGGLFRAWIDDAGEKQMMVFREKF